MELFSSGHRRGVVAAPHEAAIEAGRHVIAEGGNAIEAIIAMAATIAVVYPHMNHVGAQARITAEKLSELHDVPGFAQTFLVDGKPPAAGTSLTQSALAALLDHLA